MLINHPTDGATRGLTFRVRLLGKKTKNRIIFFWPKNLLSANPMPLAKMEIKRRIEPGTCAHHGNARLLGSLSFLYAMEAGDRAGSEVH